MSVHPCHGWHSLMGAWRTLQMTLCNHLLWYLLFTVHFLAMPTLVNKKYSYYDTPDGEDLDKKAWYVAQWAAIAGKFFTHCLNLVKFDTKEFSWIKLLVDTLYRFCSHYQMNLVLLSTVTTWRYTLLRIIKFILKVYCATLAISRNGTKAYQPGTLCRWSWFSPEQCHWDDCYHCSIHKCYVIYWKNCNCHISKKTIDGVGTTKPYDYYCVCVGYVHGTATFAVQTTPVSRTATAINYGKYLGRYREYTSAQQLYKLMSS